MKRLLVCLLACMISALDVGAQDHNSGLDSLSQLSRSGQLPQLIQSASSLLGSGGLSPTDRGIALAYLAYGYQQSGDLRRAVTSYEQALAVIDRDGQHPAEYATTLAALATLYAELGQVDTAKHVLIRSIHVFEKQNDHAGVALIWTNLATIAADEHSRREAHKCLAHALAESQLASAITPDQLAALASTQARVAQLDGDAETAISSYRRSLTLWRQTHSDQQTQTGWLYVLLGGAYLDANDLADARDTTLRGLKILEATSGRETPRYFAAELTYSKVLDASGLHTEASRLRTAAQSALTSATESSQNTISISALR